MRAIACIIIAATAFLLAGCGISNPAWIQELVAIQKSSPVDEYRLLRAPTDPAPVRCMVPEWGPVSHVAIALPRQVLSRKDVLLSMLDVVAASLAATDVMLFVPENDPEAIVQVRTALSARGLADQLRAGPGYGRIDIVPVNTDTIWIRDYGPVFAEGPGGKLVILDSIYDDIRNRTEEQETQLRQLPSETVPVLKRSDDDVFPLYINQLLTFEFSLTTSYVRPPLSLSGGDILVDENGNALVSYETVAINGGDRTRVAELVRRYFGCEQVIYLEPLPGFTVKHVDMFIKPVPGGTILVGEYRPEASEGEVYFEYLQERAARALDRNVDILRRLPKAPKILRVPMPPIVRDLDTDRLAKTIWKRAILKFASVNDERLSREDKLARRKFLFDKALHLESISHTTLEQLAYAVFLPEFVTRLKDSGRDDPDTIARVGADIVASSLELLREQDLSFWERLEEVEDESGIEGVSRALASKIEPSPGRESIQVCRGIVRKWVASICDVARNSEFAGCFDFVYLTYLNSLIVTGNRDKIVLVPRYSQIMGMESEVEAVYREALPGYRVVWVNCDTVIRQMGAVHCFTLTLPAATPQKHSVPRH